MGIKDKFKFGNDRDASNDLDRPVNLYVHQRDKKGSISAVAPYRLIIDNGQSMYEVPPGSGKFYSQNGQMIQEMDQDTAKSRDEKGFKGFDSGAPMSHPVGPPKEGTLGEVKDKDERAKAGDDHVSQVRAQQELNEQGGKHSQQNFQQAPQTKGSFTSKPDDGGDDKKKNQS